MGYMCLFLFWFPQGICLGVGLLGHMVALLLVFFGMCCMAQKIQIGALYQPRGMRLGGRREAGSKGRGYMYS